MFNGMAARAIASPKGILLAAAALAILCATAGATAPSHLLAGGQLNPTAESARANELLSRHFGQQEMNLTLLLHSDKTIDDPQVVRTAHSLLRQVQASAGVTSVLSPWITTPSVASSLVTDDRKEALIVAAISGGEEQAPKNAKAIAQQVSGSQGSLTVSAGGMAMVQSEIADQSQRDLLTMELIAVPLSFIALVGVFGGLYSALLPLLVGGIAIAGTLAGLRLLTMVTDVSVYALNVTTALALALGIDYTLLLLSRYREQVRQHGNRDEALRVSLARSGRTILFSAVTVALALSTLTVFPLYFLRSMAYAGIEVVVIASASTVVVAPALIKLLGDRIDKLNFFALLGHWLHNRHQSNTHHSHSFWYRTAKYAMRHPVPVLGSGIAVLLILATPLTDIRFGMPTEKILPASSPARQVGEAVQSHLPVNPTNITSIVLSDAYSLDTMALATYADALSRIPGVRMVNAPDGTHRNGAPAGPPTYWTGRKDGFIWLTVIRHSGIAAFSPAAERQRLALHTVPVPGAAIAQFTSQEQLSADADTAVLEKLPLVGALIAAATLALLFLFTGSVLLPVKSLLLNLLTLSAALGPVVWIFQNGHLGAFGTTTTDTLVLNMLVFAATLTFGLSMDYEVFIIARIREHWLASAHTPADNEESVAQGISASGTVVTAAAMLMCIVFAAMSSAQVAFVRMFAVCLVIAIAADALLVRMTLVPAFMQLAGRRNWWAPKPLAALHQRIGLVENDTGFRPNLQTGR